MTTRFTRRRTLEMSLAMPLSACGRRVLDVVETPGAPANITLEIDFDTPTGVTASRLHHGVNAFAACAAANTTAVYRRNLRTMNPGLVRFYRQEMALDVTANPAGWVRDAARASYAWDETRIAAATDPALLPPSAEVMINIPAWPRFLGDPDLPLAVDQHLAFAAHAASLVRLVNVQLRRKVSRFEILSEREGLYMDRPAEMAALFTTTARAMKAVDPTVAIGGPAFTQPWHPVVEPFMAAAGSEIAFVSYNGFGSGDGTAPSAALFSGGAGFGVAAARMKSVVKATGRSVPIFHTLYNMHAKAPDPRMQGAPSAVFDALAVRAFVEAELTGGAAWNDCDDWYGKLDSAGTMRPAAHVFSLLNDFLTGAVVVSRSSAPGAVDVLAVAAPGRRAYLVINRQESATRARVVARGASLGSGLWAQVTTSGRVDRALNEQVMAGPAGVPLPALSVSLFAAG